MKPKVVKAWACGRCNKTFVHNEHGKQFAEVCCLCTVCKKRPAAYTGMHMRCRECHNAAELKSAEENLVRAQEYLERAKKGVGLI